ncbi:Abi-alpha family protein [Tenacibaculum sp. 1_MG-2023]|uniref:Abi-alpha family protein n=1 Tax=Tenacibaculum sp. 1_MG-2023 TaxID=3062653 RepID=UPI0026E1619E|nr:Abi-alpha family protein [Tenacibaculum sp. 1_MG-2023]MDO6675622.1 Abi-alpha family protein [Tenacibaculum sp. 1_MG-2023]
MKEELEKINGIGLAAEKALNFIEKLIAAPLIEGTGILTDKVEYWRFKNKVGIILKAKEFLKLKGIETPKKIPVKDLSTLLEYSSYEEDNFMKDSWANLLSNSLNPENKFDSNNIFIQILNQISSDEIVLLSSINKLSSLDKLDRHLLKEEIKEKLEAFNEEIKLVLIDNLLRLGVLKELYDVNFSNSIVPGPLDNVFLGEFYSLTNLGKTFLGKITS